MKKRAQPKSQVVELLFAVAKELGVTSDRDLANLVGVSAETVTNWRTGAVSELKASKLAAVIAGLGSRIALLRDRAHAERAAFELGLCPIEVEQGSGPADLQRQFRDKVGYDYLGHRFLYFEPQGAMAWEMIIKSGYDQDRWLRGAGSCADAWLSTKRDRRGRLEGPIAQACGLDRRGRARGIDVISLGPGEGDKELLLLERLKATEESAGARFPWLALCLVDVSIPLLLEAVRSNQRALAPDADNMQVLPVCADFEEGSLKFLGRLPTGREGSSGGVRLVLMLGGTFGNLRDEEQWVREKLWRIARSGDFVWLEVGLRPERIEDEPLYQLTDASRSQTSAETSRRRLLTGPYRRWEAASGRPSSPLVMRIWVREEDESSSVPGSINFCHDILIGDEDRAVTMLYSRRYEMEGLTKWLEGLDFSVERIVRIADTKGRHRVAHLLLQRK